MSSLSKFRLIETTDKLPIISQFSKSEQIEWTGPLASDDVGYYYTEGHNTFMAFEIPVLPDFSSSRFQDFQKLSDDERIHKVIERQSQFISSIYNICLQMHTSLSIRYIYWPAKFGKKIKLVLLINTFQSEFDDIGLAGESVYKQICSNFPIDFYKFEKIPANSLEEFIELNWVNSFTEILRHENIFEPLYPKFAPIPFWYYPAPFNVKLNSYVSLFNNIISQNSKILIDLTLIPTRISLFEKQILRPLIIEYDKWGKGYEFNENRSPSRSNEKSIHGIDFIDTTQRTRSERLEPDLHAQTAAKVFTEIFENYVNNPVFLYGIRVLSENELCNSIVSDALAASIFHGPSQKLTFDRNESYFAELLESIQNCTISPFASRPDFWNHEKAPRKLMRLHRLVDLNEAISFFHLPIPSSDGIAGVDLDSGVILPPPKKTNEFVTLGNFARLGTKTDENAGFALNSLSKHALIVGVPGSGKTTTCFHVLDQLWRNFKIPFIAIEPAKTEYRGMKTIKGLEDIHVFSLGDEQISPFRFNPFEIYDRVALERHISNLAACFNGAWDLPNPLPLIFSKAFEAIYFDKGWTLDARGGEDPSLETPTMDDFYEKVYELIEKDKNRDAEMRGNLISAGAERINSFRRGSKGRMLNTKKSIPIEILMTQPIVLELDALNEEDRALMTMFILTMIREYATVQRKSGSDLKHIILVEEAHNIIGNVSAGRSSDSANPKVKAINYFVAMLAEMRALGEGIIIADQLPSALAPEAVKNTNIKIMHRLTSEDDRKTLGISMTIKSEQFNQAALLSPGESFIFMEGWPNARHVIEPNYKEIHKVGEPPDNFETQALMQPFHDEHTAIYMPFKECYIKCSKCNRKIRAKAEWFMHQNQDEINELFEQVLNSSGESTRTVCLFLEYIQNPVENDYDLMTLACFYAHFVNSKLNARRICKKSFNCKNNCPVNFEEFKNMYIEIAEKI